MQVFLPNGARGLAVRSILYGKECYVQNMGRTARICAGSGGVRPKGLISLIRLAGWSMKTLRQQRLLKIGFKWLWEGEIEFTFGKTLSGTPFRFVSLFQGSSLCPRTKTRGYRSLDCGNDQIGCGRDSRSFILTLQLDLVSVVGGLELVGGVLCVECQADPMRHLYQKKKRKNHYKEEWFPPSVNGLKFNVDGSSRGKPGQAGIGGVLHNANGRILCLFSAHVGMEESNTSEILAIHRALKLCVSKPELKGRDMVIVSDSKVAVS
ncbi:hypothetical protein Dsin_022768 [Dipteronia sinensis]|uniref:RNase H type-1 domain-containing protein n=1 Tax=Dipteronia sinensis TaxID=43782 RepID=A0AAE0A2E6_9ROSI|nr:hypothetical protein Dsin_022768 [Dipteronia sinensis]